MTQWQCQHQDQYANVKYQLGIDIKKVNRLQKQTCGFVYGVECHFQQHFGYSCILWRSVLLLDETRVCGDKHRPAANH